MDYKELYRGVHDVLPFAIGVIPFGLATGIAATDAGFDLFHLIGMSLIVFAGAAQLAALDLIGENAPFLIVILAAIVVNIRLVMYSASLAPYLRNLNRRSKAGIAYLLTDQAYALAITKYRSGETHDRFAYFLGAGLSLWIVWQITTILGLLLVSGIPPAWGLGFVVPLMFIALLIPLIDDRPTMIAGSVSGVTAVAVDGFPLETGLLAASSIGIVLGYVADTLLHTHGDNSE